MPDAHPEAYLNFLLEVLQATDENGVDKQVVYPLLQANLDKLDDTLIELLQNWGTAILSKAEPDEASRIVTTIHDFSILIQEFPLGSKAVNQEMAITGYEIALTVYTRSAFPEDWAGSQNNLGVAYLSRIQGEKADNIERAIASFNASLEVYTRSAFPEQWAGSQNNLGVAYLSRIQGEKADNIERAIASYNAILEVYTRSAFPYYWARTQNNLGLAYWNRIRGERADNIERAIASYNASLGVYTRSAFPEEWARSQNNLGNAYWNRIQGERADNIERAIASYNASLKVYTREAFPEEWARSQNNLGNAYWNRIQGERTDNIEQAIASYNASLEVYTRSAFPEEWARSQNNLGLAYLYRIQGERADNIERAIASYNASLEVYTRSAFPEQWAGNQNNLGAAYSDRIRGERADNIERAIASYNVSLEVYTRSAFPEQWASTQNNLGTAYSHLGQIPEAFECFRLALEIRTPSALPLDCLQTGRNLGETAFQSEHWSEAIAGYGAAIQAVEQSCEWASSETTRQELRQDAIDVYTKIVQACIKANQIENAIEYIERSKARTLVELLANRHLSPKGDVPPELLNQLKQLKRELPAKRQLLATAQTLNSDAAQKLRQEVSELQPQLQQLLEQIQLIDPSYQLTQTVRPISYTEIHDLLDNRTAILLWYITSERFFTFVITHQNPPYVWQSSADDLAELEQWGDDYLTDYDTFKREKNPQWQTNLASRLEQLSAILHLDEILTHVPKECQQLILIPHRYLHLFPLHALPLRNLTPPALLTKAPVPCEGRGEQDSLVSPSVSSQLGKSSPPFLTLTGEDLTSPRLTQTPSFCPPDPPNLGGVNPVPPKVGGLGGRRRKSCSPSNRENYLLDNFPAGIRYAPSFQLLQLVEQRQRLTPTSPHLFAIQNPTRDLRYTDIEVETIERTFNPNTHILKKNDATKTAFTQVQTILRNAHYAHFSCHGAFNFDSPLHSALILAESVIANANLPSNADSFREPTPATNTRYQPWYNNQVFDIQKSLTLQDIFESLDLPDCRLVTLSACETGLTNFNSLTDEYIGFASGFLYAGSLCVVCSLWNVDDFATAFLMIQFYQNLRMLWTNPDLSHANYSTVAKALNEAQCWLRQVTKTDLQTWMQPLNLDQRQIKNIEWRLRRYNDPPFHNPEYWAAFCAVGK
jgi:CHAT domain-containing protein/predicted LPLAT superfamily acyltransferase